MNHRRIPQHNSNRKNNLSPTFHSCGVCLFQINKSLLLKNGQMSLPFSFWCASSFCFFCVLQSERWWCYGGVGTNITTVMMLSANIPTFPTIPATTQCCCCCGVFIIYLFINSPYLLGDEIGSLCCCILLIGCNIPACFSFRYTPNTQQPTTNTAS